MDNLYVNALFVFWVSWIIFGMIERHLNKRAEKHAELEGRRVSDVELFRLTRQSGDLSVSVECVNDGARLTFPYDAAFRELMKDRLSVLVIGYTWHDGDRLMITLVNEVDE